MQVRKCTEPYLDDTIRFYDRVTAYLDAHVNYPKWIPGAYPGAESTRRAMEAGVQYICLDAGRITGAFILNDDPQGDYSAGEWSRALRQGEYLVLHTLAVEPERYGRGIGRFMTEYCIRAAQERGFQALRLDVVPDNIPARRLYEKMGFRYAGTKDLKRDIEAIPEFALYERMTER